MLLLPYFLPILILFDLFERACACALNFLTLSTIHKKCFPSSILIQFQFCLVDLKKLVHGHSTASRISEILISNQLALIKDELLCY